MVTKTLCISVLKMRLLLNPKEVIASFVFELYVLLRKGFRPFKGRVIMTSSAFQSCHKYQWSKSCFYSYISGNIYCGLFVQLKRRQFSVFPFSNSQRNSSLQIPFALNIMYNYMGMHDTVHIHEPSLIAEIANLYSLWKTFV